MTDARKAEEPKIEKRLGREIEIAAPVDEVWRALTEPNELAQWFPLEMRAEGKNR